MKWNRINEGVESPSDNVAWDVDIHVIDPYGFDFRGISRKTRFLIDEYINDLARKYYTNGNIPEDEEEELREGLTCVYSEFNYFDDELNEETIGNLMIVIDKGDGSLVNYDQFGGIPDDVFEYVKKLSYDQVGIKMGSQNVSIGF